MASPFSEMIANTREQVLSSDVNRLQRLSSRELQDLIRRWSSDAGGSDISGMIRESSLTAIAASFTMTLAAGQGFSSTIFGGVGVDDSRFQVIRWDAQVATFAAPDPVNPRFDIVVATPATLATDLVSRNILVDPTLRTVVASNVNKTLNPRSTITVVTGMAAGTPVPPAVPAGGIALFEVFVPPAVADSTSFVPVPRLFRLALNPTSKMHGVVQGCGLVWEQVAPPTFPGLFGTGGFDNMVIIDGEAIPFFSSFGAGVRVPQVEPDGGALGPLNPFNVANAALANNDRPHYLYLVGGRHAPQASGAVTLGFAKVPVTIVASLTPPDLTTGKPTSTLTTTRGVAPVDACVYIGLGFVFKGTADSRACLMDGEWVTPGVPGVGSTAFVELVPTNPGLTAPGANRPVTIPVTGLPAGAARARFQYIAAPDAAVVGTRFMSLQNAFGFLDVWDVQQTAAGDSFRALGTVEGAFAPTAPQLAVGDNNALTDDEVTALSIIAWPHHARRFDNDGPLTTP